MIRKAKRCTVFIMSVLLMLSVGVGNTGLIVGGKGAVQTTQNATDNKVTFTIGAIEEKIDKGSILYVPDAQASYNGESLKVLHRIILPDGSTTAEYFVIAGQSGVYRIVFSAVKDGILYSEERTVTADNTSATLFRNVKGAKTEPAAALPGYFGVSQRGLKVTAASGGVVEYSDVLNLGNFGKDDSLIKLYLAPEQKEVAEFSELLITLADAHDSTNSLTFKIHTDKKGGLAYKVRVAVKTSQMIDYVANEKIETPKGSGVYTTGKGPNDGTLVRATFSGVSGTQDAYPIELFYDYDAQSLYATHAENAGLIGTIENGKILVADLKDPAFVEQYKWSGFSNGDVRLSLKFNMLTQSSANILITDVAGISLSAEEVKDFVPPVIRIEYPYGADSLPVAVKEQQYRLFGASAYDVQNGASDVFVKIYTPGGELAAIKRAGDYFVPMHEGQYLLRYTSQDRAGNIACQDVRIESVVSAPALSVTVNEEFFSNTQMLTGLGVELPALSVSGGNGEPEYTVEYEYDGQSTGLTDSYFVPVSAGEYKVTYRVKDYTSAKTIVRTFNVSTNPMPVVTEPYIPSALIAGTEFVVPDFGAMDYTSGTEQAALKKIMLTKNGVTKEVEAGERILVEAGSGYDSISLKYQATTHSASPQGWERSYNVAVRKTVTLFDSYFVTKDINNSALATHNMSFKSSTGDGKISFINALPDTIQLRFKLPEGMRAYEYFYISLTDAVESTRTVTLKFFHGEQNTLFFEHAQGRYQVTVAADGMINLSVGTNGVYDNNSARSITGFLKYDGHKAFEGFLSSRMYLNMGFSGVTGNSELLLTAIGNQMFNSSKIDFSPAKYYSAAVPSSAEFGSAYTLPALFAYDILDMSSQAVVTVISPSGKKIFDRADVSASLSFVPDEYGIYQVEYIVIDKDGVPDSEYYTVNARDTVPPVINVAGVPGSGKAGKEVILPKAQLSDNSDSVDKLVQRIMIFQPNGIMKIISDNKFVPDVAGVYTVRYYVRDSAYNYSYLDFAVVVG